jgi:hypothetical protein
MIKISKTGNFTKRYVRLPKSIQKQVDKQIRNIFTDFYHPALNTKKMSSGWWEFRVSRGYRMTGFKLKNELTLNTVGPHDEGLGKH